MERETPRIPVGVAKFLSAAIIGLGIGAMFVLLAALLLLVF